MKPNYRRCVSCRALAQKHLLWRVVRVATDGKLQLDQGMGRSAYVCPTEHCLRMAQKKNRLSRALKVSVPDKIYQQLEARLSS